MAAKGYDPEYRPDHKGIAEWLATSQDLRRETLNATIRVASAYMAELPVRTGNLKGRTSVHLTWSDHKRDRPMGEVRNDAHYAVWNLTGAGPGMHRRSTGRVPKFGPFQGDYTFDRVISMMNKG